MLEEGCLQASDQAVVGRGVCLVDHAKAPPNRQGNAIDIAGIDQDLFRIVPAQPGIEPGQREKPDTLDLRGRNQRQLKGSFYAVVVIDVFDRPAVELLAAD